MRASGAMLLAGLIAASAPFERVVSGDRVVAITVDGQPLRFRIDPGAPGLPVMKAAVAERLNLKGGGLLGVGMIYTIGSERVSGRTQVTRFAWDGAAKGRRRVGWVTRDWALPADGTVGPAGVPEGVVRFQLRPPRAGERTVAMPMFAAGGLFAEWFAIGATVLVDGKPLVVRFDLEGRHSMVTAPAAVRLQAANGGVLTRETARQEVLFGVERPLRIMRLARPLAIGPLSLEDVAVRTTDGPGVNALRVEGDDPEEVLVNGDKNPRPGSMRLGTDQLAHCSSIVFDKPAKQVRLTCG